MKYKTSCGGTIVVPPKTQSHLWAHPEVGEILSEVLAHLTLPKDGKFLEQEIDIGRVVGRAGRISTVPIQPNTPAQFAKRIGRAGPSRVLVEVQGPETSIVSVLAFPARGEKNVYILVTAWVGPLARKEPWDQNIRTEAESKECLTFWCKEALVYDKEVMGPPFTSSWEKILRDFS